MPYDTKTIRTLTGGSYDGCVLSNGVCGVSVVRAGVCMENALRLLIKDVPIGKILIQTDEPTMEPVLHYCKLPPDINKRYVVLVDAQIASGAAALMAIRVVLDHHVPEDHIVFLALLATPVGLSAISQAFPNVKIVVGHIDQELTDAYYIVPGMGNFGNRYFGTE